MKNIVVLFTGHKPAFTFEKSFGSKSAFDRCLNWASSISDSIKTVILTTKACRSFVNDAIISQKNITVIEAENWTNASLAKAVADQTAACNADFAVFSWADCPFINNKLSADVISDHIEYKAEYCFADGFAAGLTPETIDRGAASIIATLAEDTQKCAGSKPASRDCFFSIMSGDINSFEIETVLADKDYRSLRYSFDCSSKAGYTACCRLYAESEKTIPELKAGNDYDIYALSDLAQGMASIQQTLPGYFNIQISAEYNTKSLYNPYEKLLPENNLSDMKFEDFKQLVKKIAIFSPDATVGLSLFGEPSLNPRFVDFAREVLSYEGLSLFIETDGLCLSEDIVSAIASVNDSTNAYGRLDWCVQLDGTDAAMYSKINGIDGSNFEKAVASVSLLEKYFENRVYPQFTRMKANEPQLEQFFRFWKEKESPSKGQLLIMKYDSCAGLLSDEKPADLAPLERNVCWHLRRDMNILSDGSVLMCRSRADEIAGNAFSEELETVWRKITEEVQKHINLNYCEKCRACDEYYTFNF